MFPFVMGGIGIDARVTGTRIDNSVQSTVVPPAGAAPGELAIVVCYQAASSISGGAALAWNSIQPAGTNFRIFWRLWAANDFTVALTLNFATPYAAASVQGARSVALGSEATAISTPGPTFSGALAGFARSGACVGFINFAQAAASAITFQPALVGQSMNHAAGTYAVASTITTDTTQIVDGAPIGVTANTDSDTRYVGVYQLLAT